MSVSDKRILALATRALEIEADAVTALIPRLDQAFAKATRLLLSCKGKVVLTGMGKAGIIAQKSSATLSSIGTPSVWMHLAEAVHGDLGRIEHMDIAIVLSYSGETDELRTVVPVLKKIGSRVIAVTGNLHSFLAQHADIVLDVRVEREACPLGLAPTTSTTAMLALCDAIAVTLQELKGFKAKDFAFYHPKGSLGRKLLLHVEDCMRTLKRTPMVLEQTRVSDAILSITKARAGACVIVGEDKKLKGIFTDGDLRRALEKHRNLRAMPIADVMTRTPIVAHPDTPVSEVMRVIEKHKVDELPVVDADGRVIGLLDVQDLLAAGVM
jgi:arabinose-5-phosphate isomerase